MAVRYADDVKRPFRCMFIRDEKIKNGQRVAVRLLEAYDSDGLAGIYCPEAYGISIFCDNVFIKDDVMYVVLNIENKSATTYSLS